MPQTLTERHASNEATRFYRLADLGRVVVGAAGGALAGIAAGAIFCSMITMLFGGIGGAIAGMIAVEKAADAEAAG
jgi:hypothetical protein